MLPTLKGIFPEPKIQHKRDFLRENKLHLKNLARNQSRQQVQKEEEELKLAELRRRQRLKLIDTRAFLARKRPVSECSCECGKTVETVTICRPVSGASTERRKVDTCNREVQTDDIVDEEFLYKALKRCSSSDLGREVHTNNIPMDNHLPNPIANNHHDIDDHNLNFENLSIDTERPPLPTASSTQLSTKRGIRRIHELGDRQDLRLPKYLEREKRDKEQQKQKELDRDRNCPIGYQALTEEQRKSALNKAQTNFQDLVNELNRMPMTTETLRMRSRKVEIERELAELESDIKIFSKPKVYVKGAAMV